MNFYRLKIIGNKLHTLEKSLELSNSKNNLTKNEIKLILNETNDNKIELDNLIINQSKSSNSELSSKLKTLYTEINYIKNLTNNFLN